MHLSEVVGSDGLRKCLVYWVDEHEVESEMKSGPFFAGAISGEGFMNRSIVVATHEDAQTGRI